MILKLLSRTLSIYIIIQLIYSHGEANCPPKSQVGANAVSGSTQFGGRTLHQECCVSGRRQCECNFGLECCKNHANTRICIDNPCGGCANGRCVERNGQARCVCNSGFVLNRSSNCVRRGNGNNRGRQKPQQRTQTNGILEGFFAPRRSTSALGVLLCSSNPCINGECLVVRNQVQCRCFPGFVLNQLTQTCDDPDQFTTVPPTVDSTTPASRIPVVAISTTATPITDPRCGLNICGANSVCTVQSDVVVCVCKPGATLSPQGTCFFDSCTADVCGPSETCTLNSDFSGHECVCVDGLTRNLENECVDPICAASCGTNTNCQVGANGLAVCICKPGAFLAPSGGCVNSTCDNSCGPTEVCTTDGGVATCTCRPGFTQDPLTGACLDPCIPNPCLLSQTCTVHVESRSTSCECADGLTEAADGSCITDPCNPNPCGAGGTCILQGRTAVCSCSTGFILSANTCIDDPCEPNPCGFGGSCVLQGNTHTCNCFLGFLKVNGSCVDDPCNPSPCGIGGTCAVLEGSTIANCTCSSDFLHRNNVCIVNPCEPNPCGGGVCTVDISGQPNCTCSENFVSSEGGICVPATSDPCIPNPCGVGGACVTLTTGVSCQCNPGFSLNTNGTCSVATTTQSPVTQPQPDTTLSSGGSNNGPSTSPPVPCPAGVSCGVGTCTLNDGQHACNCPAGFRFTNSTCVFSAPCDPQTTQSTLELGDSGTVKIPAGSTTGCLKSRNYPSAPYTASLFDEVELDVRGHATMHIIIENLETQPEESSPLLRVNTCQADFLFVKGQLFCGFISKSHKPALRILNISDLDTITMGFVSDTQNEFSGFLLRWIIL